jgi:NADH dehydrogenase
MKNLVILGGGYGGQTIVNHLLDKDFPEEYEITLVDRMPYQGLKTEYYALASGTVSDVDIRAEFTTDARVTKTFGEVLEVDPVRKEVHFQDREPLAYDWLVVGLGCVDKYHNIPGAEAFTNSIQTLSAARMTYQRVNDVRPYGQVSIVGGGLSGVEMAAELRESRPDLNIRIIDRGPSILSAFPGKLQSFVREWMEEHNIDMLSHVSLSRVEPGVLHNQDQRIETNVTIWTAGIQPSPVVQKLEVEKDPTGRVVLNEFHQIPQYTNIFVVGDCASLVFSPSAQAAEAQGKQVAEVLLAEWKGKTPDLGSLGKKTGFGVMGKKTVLMGKVPRALKSGVLWMSKRHFG